MKVLIFGSEYRDDDLALRVARSLRRSMKGVEFEECDPEEVLSKGDDLLIMDVAQNTDDCMLIEGVEGLDLPPRVSTHDADLVLQLKVGLKTGYIKRVRIISLPMGMELRRAKECARRLLDLINSNP